MVKRKYSFIVLLRLIGCTKKSKNSAIWSNSSIFSPNLLVQLDLGPKLVLLEICSFPAAS